MICNECSGEGTIYCFECYGEGYTLCDYDCDSWECAEMCTECEGAGLWVCPTCKGTGQRKEISSVLSPCCRQPFVVSEPYEETFIGDKIHYHAECKQCGHGYTLEEVKPLAS